MFVALGPVQPTHTDRLLDQSSYNSTSHKATTIQTLTRRAQLVCDSPDSLADENNYSDNVFNNNNYNKDFVRRNTYKNTGPNATNNNATPVTTCFGTGQGRICGVVGTRWGGVGSFFHFPFCLHIVPCLPCHMTCIIMMMVLAKIFCTYSLFLRSNNGLRLNYSSCESLATSGIVLFMWPPLNYRTIFHVH